LLRSGWEVKPKNIKIAAGGVIEGKS